MLKTKNKLKAFEKDTVIGRFGNQQLPSRIQDESPTIPKISRYRGELLTISDTSRYRREFSANYRPLQKSGVTVEESGRVIGRSENWRIGADQAKVRKISILFVIIGKLR